MTAPLGFLDNVGSAAGLLNALGYNWVPGAPEWYTSAQAATAGTIFVTKIFVPTNVPISTFYVPIGNAISTATANQSFFGLYDSNSNLLWKSTAGAIDTALGTANSVVSQPVSVGGSGGLGSYSKTNIDEPVGTTWVWAAQLYNASTGPTPWSRTNVTTGPQSSVKLAGIAGTGQTSLPATLGAVTATAYQFFVALS